MGVWFSYVEIMPVEVRRGRRIPLKLELKAVMSCLMWVLQSSGPLQEQQGLIPQTSNSSSKGFNPLFWSPKAPGINVVYKHTCSLNTHTHKTNVNKY